MNQALFLVIGMAFLITGFMTFGLFIKLDGFPTKIAFLILFTLGVAMFILSFAL